MGLGFRVLGLGFRVLGLGLRVLGLGLWVYPVFTVYGLGVFRDLGSVFRVSIP